MATISSLLQRLSRKSKAEASVKVTAFGFTVGSDVIAWQSVSEIWGYKVDLLTTDEAFIEFVAAGQSFAVSEEAMGFEALESAMSRLSLLPRLGVRWCCTLLLPPTGRCCTVAPNNSFKPNPLRGSA